MCAIHRSPDQTTGRSFGDAHDFAPRRKSLRNLFSFEMQLIPL
jgi:hypothetical protein